MLKVLFLHIYDNYISNMYALYQISGKDGKKWTKLISKFSHIF